MYKKHTDDVIDILASSDITKKKKKLAAYHLDQAYKLKRREAVNRNRRLQTLPVELSAYIGGRCHDCKLRRLACAPEAVAIAYLVRLLNQLEKL